MLKEESERRRVESIDSVADEKEQIQLKKSDVKEQ